MRDDRAVRSGLVSREPRLSPGPLSRHQAVTLASLIEAEAKDGSERTRISSVFHNRLKRKMRLQCDPTVIYAMGGLDRPLLRKDWQYESPYNTYLVAGLPPGPICSPGEAALYRGALPRYDGPALLRRAWRRHHTSSPARWPSTSAPREIKRNSAT